MHRRSALLRLTCRLLTLWSVAAPLALSAQIESATRLTAAPAQYHRVDFVVMLTAPWEDPHRSADVTLDLQLTSPSGRSVVVPAYYERGESGEPSIWHARFTPREAGAYQGRFLLRTPGSEHASAPVDFAVAPSATRGFLHPSTPWTLVFDNGQPFRGIGENLCWEARLFDDSRHLRALNENPRYNYEYLVGSLSRQGGNFFRTWMCSWNLPLEWKHVRETARYASDSAHFNRTAIQRMDDLVEVATATDTYFMLALDPHGSFLGVGWESSNYNVKNGGPAATPLEFFTAPAAKAQYKDRLRFLVARWGWSPHLAVWEFFNEVDNAMYGQKPNRIPDEVVAAWHAEMSAYLAQLDPYDHVISTSISHRDVAGLNSVPHLDLNQRHIYGDTDRIPDLIRSHLRSDGKPYVIGEFSFEWDWTKDFNRIADQMDHDFKHGLWLGLFSPTPILPMSWWWEFFDHRGLTSYLQRVRALHEQMLTAGQGHYEEVAAQWEGAALRHVLAVRCGTTTFVLLSNAADAAVSGRLALPAGTRGGSVRRYEPEADSFTAASPLAADGRIDPGSIPARSDIILIVTEP